MSPARLALVKRYADAMRTARVPSPASLAESYAEGWRYAADLYNEAVAGFRMARRVRP